MSEKKFGLDLTEGRVNTLLLRFAAPFLLANFVSVMYGIVGMIIVGQFTNSAVVSGVATGTQVTNLMFSFIIGIGTGGTVLIGRCMGAKNDEGARHATGSLLIITAAVIVLLTSVIWFGRETLLGLLKTQPDALPSARRFVQICTIGVPFNVGYGLLSAVSRGMGNSKIPGIIAAISCVLNIAIAYTLVGLFQMAEAGVAIATAAAQIFSFTAMALWLYKKKLPFKFSARDIRPEKRSMTQIMLIGMPIVLQELLITISFMISTSLVNAISVQASASVGVVARAFNVSVIVPLAMSSAISAITAQNLGAGKPKRAFATLSWGTGFSLAFAVVIVIFCQITPTTVTSIFSNDSEVINAAAGYLRSFSIDSLFIATVFCMNAYLSGCGKSGVSMVHSLTATFLIRIPLSIYFTGKEGLSMPDKLYQLGFASPIASILSLVVCVVFILWYRKRLASNSPIEAAPQ